MYLIEYPSSNICIYFNRSAYPCFLRFFDIKNPESFLSNFRGSYHYKQRALSLFLIYPDELANVVAAAGGVREDNLFGVVV